MKKITILSATILLLASCQMVNFDVEGDNTGTEKGQKAMNFRLTTYKMYDIDEIYGNEEESRATAKEATDHLLLGIYDAQGNLVDTIAYQDKDDTTLPSYGTFSHTLKYGKYTLLALGWNGTQKCTVHRPDSISFSEGWAPHTFLCRQNIVVSDAFSDTRSLSLKRCIAKFTVVQKDKIKPEGISDFVFRFSGAGCSLNSETGFSAQQKDFSRTIAIPNPSSFGSVTSYCFLPSDSTGLSINVAARDAAGNILAEKTFEEVPMKINYDTRYSGNFFAISSSDTSIDIDTEYGGSFNIEF